MHTFAVQHHCRKYKSQVCNNDCYIITMLCVENLYLEVNTYVRLWSLKLHSAGTSDGGQSGWDRDTIHTIIRHCHVMVCNRFILFSRGRRVCCWSQSQLSPGEGRVHPGQVANSSQGPQEQFGVQYLAQGHFNIQLSSAWGSQDLNQWPSDHQPTCSTCWATES